MEPTPHRAEPLARGRGKDGIGVRGHGASWWSKGRTPCRTRSARHRCAADGASAPDRVLSRAVGGNLRRLTNSQAIDTNPAWSPNDPPGTNPQRLTVPHAHHATQNAAGIVTVPDPRQDMLAEIVKPERVVATTMEFIDIAGIVAGASKGEGLGNKFLANIREVDAIVQVVRCFEDPDVLHVSGTVDPVRDIEVITTELVLADHDSVTKRIDKTQKKAKSGDKEAIAELALLEKLSPHLNSGKTANTLTANSAFGNADWGIEAVAGLFPEARDYTDVYDRAGALGELDEARQLLVAHLLRAARLGHHVRGSLREALVEHPREADREDPEGPRRALGPEVS